MKARRVIFERQLARVRDIEIEHHDVLNVATTLMLLAATPGWQASDDVEGHCFGFAADGDDTAVVRAQRHLQWVRAHAQGGDIDELRRRTRSAAEELARYLDSVSGGDAKF
jgi:hypothetical protein